MYIFIYFWAGVGHRDILHLFVWGSSPPPPHSPLKSIEIGETPSVCRELLCLFISIIKKT